MDGSEPQEDLDAGPLEDRLVSKKWNVRRNAYEELTALFVRAEEDNDPIFGKHSATIQKILVDGNVMAQEKGLAAVAEWVTRTPLALKSVSSICAGLIDKCIAGRPGAKQKSLEIFMQFVEREVQEPAIVRLSLSLLFFSLHLKGKRKVFKKKEEEEKELTKL